MGVVHITLVVRIWEVSPYLQQVYFLKPFKKGNILRTGKGGKLDFGPYFGILTMILKR